MGFLTLLFLLLRKILFMFRHLKDKLFMRNIFIENRRIKISLTFWKNKLLFQNKRLNLIKMKNTFILKRSRNLQRGRNLKNRFLWKIHLLWRRKGPPKAEQRHKITMQLFCFIKHIVKSTNFKKLLKNWGIFTLK